jgi:hypothetical protein
MSLFDLFRKKTPLQVLVELRHAVVVSSLAFRKHAGEDANDLTAAAGAELLCFLVHVADQFMNRELSTPDYKSYSEILILDSIKHYADAILIANAPDKLRRTTKQDLLSRFNSGQSVYSKCTLLTDDGVPTPGTKLFALAFFVHRALGHTRRTDLDGVLIGEVPITEADYGQFPGSDRIFLLAAYAGEALKSMELRKRVRALR